MWTINNIYSTTHGKSLFGFAKKLCNLSAFQAEVWGIFWGGYTKLIMEANSTWLLTFWKKMFIEITIVTCCKKWKESEDDLQMLVQEKNETLQNLCFSKLALQTLDLKDPVAIHAIKVGPCASLFYYSIVAKKPTSIVELLERGNGFIAQENTYFLKKGVKPPEKGSMRPSQQ
ncbi:uncharacterized protein G2W53_028723 [Senna tora]|uniref:Uncharacterized protein n=1 Tax=Senna tora TaxID=362788 RepID=A0A834TCT2_9FABA|nr:uncharacterized protein G2W53_028723 [Senna tora]